MTKFYKKDYPRPQFVRDQYQPLDGSWNFRFDDDNTGFNQGWHNGFSDSRQIITPFTYESPNSGIGEERFCPSVWYCRDEVFPHGPEEQVWLYFEGCDYYTRLWINGVYIGDHKGGYTRFGFDITHALREDGSAAIVVQVQDSMDMTQLRGKQRWTGENYVCWYTQTTGIWKTVWAERVHQCHLKSVKMTPVFDDNSVVFQYSVDGELSDLEVETIISFEDTVVYQGRHKALRKNFKHRAYFQLNNEFTNWDMTYWSPQAPNLYDVEFRLYRKGTRVDRVGSYFGMRKISADQGRLTLNNMDIYLRMVLDQGYWVDGLATPPDEDALRLDLQKILDYGYNGVRKHQKIEDERFYYWADVMGVLVWCEAPSTYEYDEYAASQFHKEWIDIVEQHYNHPSIIVWVPFNESWGIPRVYVDRQQQHFSEAVYHLTKTLDDTRPVVVNDGWEHTVSDILTLHDYAHSGSDINRHLARTEQILSGKEPFNGVQYALARGYSYHGQPIMITEFGGIAYKVDDGWGYGQSEMDEESFLRRFRNLIEAIEGLDYVCGYCYTQLTDVQQEMNGHMTMDRQDKVAVEKIREILQNGK